MKFELDPAKSEANRAKHGLDFIEEQRLWLDLDGTTIDIVERAERREVRVAEYLSKLWTTILVRRDGYIRIISVRRAREKEISRYEYVKRQRSLDAQH